MATADGSGRNELIEQLTGVHKLVRRGELATGRQVEAAPLKTVPEAESTAHDMRHSLEQHARDLEGRLSALGHAADGATDGVAGPPEGPDRASDALDGDHEYLQRLSLAYLRLRSAAQLHGDQESVDLADRGYAEIQFLIRERVSRAKPRAVAIEHAVPLSKTPGAVPDHGDGS